MIDRLFTAVLTFTLLGFGTAAVGDALFETTPAAAQAVAAAPAKAERRVATQSLQAEPVTRTVQ